MFIRAIAACRFDLSHLCRSANALIPERITQSAAPVCYPYRRLFMNSDFSLRELHENPSAQSINISSSACDIGTAYLLNCPVHPICVHSDGLGPDNDHETLCRLEGNKTFNHDAPAHI